MEHSHQTTAHDATSAMAGAVMVETGMVDTGMVNTGMAVHVVADRDEWNVVIVENGVERLQSFVQHDWALSYARGQRLRLGLPAISDPSVSGVTV